MTITDHEKSQERILAEIEADLVKKRNMLTSSDDSFGDYEGSSLLKPKDMSEATAAKAWASRAAALEKVEDFVHPFPMARPWDGAHAMHLTLKRVFGMAGAGVTQYDPFGGAHPPQKISVEVDVDKTIQVPWGTFQVVTKGATLELTTDSTHDETYGQIFVLHIQAPAKKTALCEALFAEIEDELSRNSIYRGKAFINGPKPKFLNPFKVDATKLALNPEEEFLLRHGLWGTIRNADLQISDGLNVNDKTLLAGDFGTGKTMSLAVTAQQALLAEMTFIQTPTGASLDQVEDTLQMAGLYAKHGNGSVVAIEDVDGIAAPGDDAANERLLELFDGIAVKENRVMIVMTSNHPENMHKGMHRPGRVDQTILFEPPQRSTVEKLIRNYVPDNRLEENINFSPVHEAMEGYQPAFIMRTFISARKFAISRYESLDYKLSTDDFAAAARLLRPQWEQHMRAHTKPAPPTIDGQLKQLWSAEFDTRRVAFDNDGKMVKIEEAS